MTGSTTASPAVARVAVIGDVGGHLAELERELTRLGADEETGVLPADLTVVQVGDLIHRGPDSAGVVALVDRYLSEQPGRWIQLVGNHEAQYLASPAFDWPEQLDATTTGIVRRWWRDGLLRVATSVRGRNGRDFLITHAGVTQMYWRTVLGAPRTAGTAAELLNDMIGRREQTLFRSGQMLGGVRPRPSVGPLWAAAGTELLPGWLSWRPPFDQIHGHSSLVRWPDDHFRGGRAARLRTMIDRTARHEVTMLAGGRRIIGIDPGHGVQPAPSWRSWLVEVA